MLTKKYRFVAILSIIASVLSIEGAFATQTTAPDCKGMYNTCMTGNLYGTNPKCQAFGDPGTPPVTACRKSDNADKPWSASCTAGCVAYPGCSADTCSP